MGKTKEINLPTAAGALGLVKGAGGDITPIVDSIKYQVTGGRQGSDGDIPGEVLGQFFDAVDDFSENPSDFAMEVGMEYLKARIPFKLLGMGLKALGIQRSVKVGNLRIKFAG